MKQTIILGLGTLLIYGCSVFTPPKAKPVIEDRVSESNSGEEKVGVLATTPERRVVIVKMPANKFCAEPSADAAENVSAALAVIAKAAAKGKLTDLQLGIASSLATTVKPLFQRSQGVQLYRDGTFMLCNAYLNNAISPEQFLERHKQLFEAVQPLINEEIPHIHKQKLDPTVLPVPLDAFDIRFSLKPVSEKPAETSEGDKKPEKPAEDGKKVQ